MEHELCGIIHLDLLLYPLELSSIAIKVLNILAAHEHRVEIKDSKSNPRKVVTVISTIKECLLDGRQLGVGGHRGVL